MVRNLTVVGNLQTSALVRSRFCYRHTGSRETLVDFSDIRMTTDSGDGRVGENKVGIKVKPKCVCGDSVIRCAMGPQRYCSGVLAEVSAHRGLVLEQVKVTSDQTVTSIHFCTVPACSE